MIRSKGDFVFIEGLNHGQEFIATKQFFYKVLRKLKSPGFIPEQNGLLVKTTIHFNVRYYNKNAFVRKGRYSIKFNKNLPTNLNRQLKNIRTEIVSTLILYDYKDIRISFTAVLGRK